MHTATCAAGQQKDIRREKYVVLLTLAMATLRLPRDVAKNFLKLAKFASPAVNQISVALSQIPVSRDQGKQIDAAVSSESDVKFDSAEHALETSRAIQALHRLYARSNSRRDDFLRDLASAIIDGIAPDAVSSEDAAKLAAVLEALLNVPGLLLGHKSAVLQLEHERFFLGARVLSDIRPIFRENMDEPLASALLCHSLKIEYWQGGERKEMYVALALEDLTVLYDALERAIAKDRRLRDELMDKFSFDATGDLL